MRVEGRRWNHKHVHRVYCALRLNLPRRTTRRVPRRVRQPLSAPPRLNQTWALDFMTETHYDGRRVRLLTMIDEGNREGLEIVMGLSVPSRRVTRALDELVAVHGCPSGVRVDNGTPLDERNVRRAFKAVLTEAELPAIRIHDLRHTTATLLLTRGVIRES